MTLDGRGPGRSTEPFLNRLNVALSESGEGGLTVRRISEGVGGWDVFIVTEEERAKAAVYEALRRPGVIEALASAELGEVRLLVHGPTRRWPVPVALLKGGELFLVSDAEAGYEPEGALREFKDWFEELIGAPPPIDLAVVQQRADVFVSPNALMRTTAGFPHVFRIDDLDAYTVVAFGGYGSNSYALYVTRVAGETQMFLRLPWGGAYMDVEKERPGLLENLREANRLFELAAEKRLPMYLNNNMGDWYFAPKALKPRWLEARPISELCPVRDHVDVGGPSA